MALVSSGGNSDSVVLVASITIAAAAARVDQFKVVWNHFSNIVRFDCERRP